MNSFIKKFKLHERFTILKLNEYAVRDESEIPQVHTGLSPEEIKKLTYKNIAIGESIMSSFVSKRRDHISPIKSSDTIVLNNQIADAVYLANSFELIFKNFSPQQFSFYNGRNYCTRSSFEVARQMKITTLSTENSGHRQGSYTIFKNCLPHDIDENTRKAISLWESRNGSKEREKTGQQYFELKEKGSALIGKSYVEKHEPDLPNGFVDQTNTNIGLFTSSDDELFAVGRDWGGVIKSQQDGIKLILDMLKEKLNYKVYVRMHPNLITASRAVIQPFIDICEKYDNVVLIRPESSISSYALLRKVDKVITFGSTIGAEACFHRKPSLALRAPLYAQLNLCDAGYLMNISELHDWIFNEQLPKPIDGAIIYGHYKLEDGIKMVSSTENSFDGQLFPRPLLTKPFTKALNGKFKRFLRRFKKTVHHQSTNLR